MENKPAIPRRIVLRDLREGEEGLGHCCVLNTKHASSIFLSFFFLFNGEETD